MDVAWLYNVKLWLLVLGVPLFAFILALGSLIVGAIFNYLSKDTGVLKTGLITGGVILMIWLWLFVKNG